MKLRGGVLLLEFEVTARVGQSANSASSLWHGAIRKFGVNRSTSLTKHMPPGSHA